MEFLTRLKTLKRRRKFVLIAAIILLPIFLLCGAVAYNVSGTVNDSRRELAGVEYLRGAWMMIAACDNGRPTSVDEFAPLPPSIGALPGLEAAERDLARRLAISPADDEACAAARGYIRRVADDSRLALDPRPDTYYLMSAAVNDLPSLSSRLTETEAESLTGIVDAGVAARAQAREVNAGGDAVRHSLGLAQADGDGTLHAALALPLRNFSRALADDVQALEAGKPAMTSGASRRVLRSTLDGLWGASVNQLARLLQHRAADALALLWLTLGGGLALAAAAIGGVVYFDLYVQRDEVVKLNQDLRQSYDELERFAYICSHDMQEPVRMMHLYAGMLMEDAHDTLDEVSRRHLTLISDNALRIRNMITDILQFSRVGRDPVPIETVDCDAILGEVLGDFNREITNRAARVTRAPLPAIDTNPTLVRIVLQNLVGNALKYQDRLRAPQIDVSAQEDARAWRFEVRDNGIGIDPAHRDAVFAIFQRLNRQEDYPGSGVGLSTCRKFLDLVGGEIDFVSAPGKGATFWFTLPKKVAK